MVRRGVFVAILALGAMLTAGAPSAGADVPVVVLDGKGWGHGVGMAQWGAKYQADGGADVATILATFYPGTEIGSSGGPIRVAVYTSPDGTAVLDFPSGGELRSPRSGEQAPGFPMAIGPGGSVVVSFDGAYHVTPRSFGQAAGPAVAYTSDSPDQLCLPFQPCSTTTTQAGGGGGNGGGGGGGPCLLGCPTTTTAPPTTQPPGPDTTAPPATSAPPPSDTGPAPAAGATSASSGSPIYAVPNGGGVTGVSARARAYRGILEATAGSGALRLVNELDVEQYLKGMGEVPSSWPGAALGAQAVVARTYALRAMSFSGEICDYDLCQVYIGATREAAAQSAAVDATAGMVLTYGGALATTVYSADAGGITACTCEAFGTPDGTYPYLTTVRYNTPDPLPWRLMVAMSDIGPRFGYPGDVTAVSIGQTGPSGRALEVILDGTGGQMVVPGRQFASKLGLRSSLFAATNTTSATAPPALVDPVPTQALPEDAAAITQAAVRGESAAAAKGAKGKEKAFSEASARQTDLLDPVVEVADEPAAWIAVTVLGVVTAAGMAQYGLVPLAPGLLLANRRRLPVLAGVGPKTHSGERRP